MQIARLIKTTRTRLGRIDCVTSQKNICANTKKSQANREAKIYRFISHIKGPFSVPCYFLAPDHMLRRSTVLMVSILSLFFGIVLHTALACTRWSPHSGFWLIVLRGTKQLHFHFIGLFSETISSQCCIVLD